MIAAGFMELQLQKLWVVHYETNHRMMHILQKLGVKKEGILRDEYFHADACHNRVRQSMLAPEFEEFCLRWGISKGHLQAKGS